MTVLSINTPQTMTRQKTYHEKIQKSGQIKVDSIIKRNKIVAKKHVLNSSHYLKKNKIKKNALQKSVSK